MAAKPPEETPPAAAEESNKPVEGEAVAATPAAEEATAAKAEGEQQQEAPVAAEDEEGAGGEFDPALKYQTKKQKTKDKFASNRQRAVGDSIWTVGKKGGTTANPVAVPEGEDRELWVAFHGNNILTKLLELIYYLPPQPMIYSGSASRCLRR